MFAYCENNPVNNSDPSGEFGWDTLIKGVIGGTVNAICTAVQGGNGKEIFTAFGTGFAQGVFCDIFSWGITVIRIYETSKAVFECRKSGATWGKSLLAGAATLYSTYVFGTQNDILVDSVTDITIGLGAAICASQITKQIQENANQNNHGNHYSYITSANYCNRRNNAPR